MSRSSESVSWLRYGSFVRRAFNTTFSLRADLIGIDEAEVFVSVEGILCWGLSVTVIIDENTKFLGRLYTRGDSGRLGIEGELHFC